MPQQSYDFAPEVRALPGQVLSLDALRDSSTYAQTFNTWTATVGGTATDGVYSFELNDETVTVTRSTTPATNTDLASALGDNLEANGDLDNVANADNSAAVLTITAIHAGEYLAIRNPVAPSPGTLVLAETVSISPAVLPPGMGVIRHSTAGQIRLPESGDADAAFAGVVERQDWNMRPNRGDPAAADGFEAGQVVPLVTRGDVAVLVDDTVAVGDTPHLRITGTGPGLFGNDTASGARIALTGCRFISATLPLPAHLAVANATGYAIVRFNRP